MNPFNDVLYLNSKQLKDADLASVIKAISFILNNDEYERFDRILDDIVIENTSIEMMLTFLRTSYQARELLNSWHSFLDKSKTEVENRGRNPEKLFKGLS